MELAIIWPALVFLTARGARSGTARDPKRTAELVILSYLLCGLRITRLGEKCRPEAHLVSPPSFMLVPSFVLGKPKSMSACQLYQVRRHTLRSREIRADRPAAVSVVKIPFCTHTHSPMSREEIMTIGAATRLQCGGDLDRCQVPLDKR